MRNALSAANALRPKGSIHNAYVTPDGKYVVVQFKTSFAQKKSAVETVTCYLEDGAWTNDAVIAAYLGQAS